MLQWYSKNILLFGGSFIGSSILRSYEMAYQKIRWGLGIITGLLCREVGPLLQCPFNVNCIGNL